MPSSFDTVVIGAGPAGLAGATALARSRRSVAVIDSGEPRNAPSPGVHNFLSRDGVSPHELARIGREQAEGYGVTFVDTRVAEVAGSLGAFDVQLANGESLVARRILVATGTTDILPAIPGLAERWGRDVIHCPYCHGFEVRDQNIGILGLGPRITHRALMFRQLSDRVTVFLDPAEDVSTEELAQLDARGVRIVRGITEEVIVEDDAMRAVSLADGSRHPIDAFVVASRTEARAGFLRGIGLEPVEHPAGVGTHVPVDAMGATSVPGVWAAGNVAEPMAQVMTSASQGLMAGAVINAHLIEEDVQLALR